MSIDKKQIKFHIINKIIGLNEFNNMKKVIEKSKDKDKVISKILNGIDVNVKSEVIRGEEDEEELNQNLADYYKDLIKWVLETECK